MDDGIAFWPQKGFKIKDAGIRKMVMDDAKEMGEEIGVKVTSEKDFLALSKYKDDYPHLYPGQLEMTKKILLPKPKVKTAPSEKQLSTLYKKATATNPDIKRLDKSIKMQEKKIEKLTKETVTIDFVTNPSLRPKWLGKIEELKELQSLKWMYEKEKIRLTSKIFNKGILPDKKGKASVFISASKAMTTKFKNKIENIEKMYHKDVLDQMPTLRLQIEKRGTRAYYRDSSKEMVLATSDDSGVLVHEFSHGVEYNVPGVYEKIIKFRNKRTKGESLTEIYKGSGEYGYKDEFFNHYCGKVYRGRGATEVLSCGIEKMYSRPVEFYKEDPEYFKLILDIMWGKL